MLLFRSEEEIAEWRRIQGRESGRMLPLVKVWTLAQRWYHDRMSVAFRGSSAERAQGIFRSLDLTDDFWLLPSG
ncbi:MAG: hypothetical protein J4G18_06770 [Anaerolineae bacterium]|nr:hypothetical protein [Anaerolineae bacterium]